MKKFTIFTCILILCFTLVSCGAEKTKNEGEKPREDVTLTIKEKEITTDTKELSLVFTNNSNNEYTYGEEPRLDIDKNGTWTEYPIITRIGWNDIAHVLKPKDKGEITFPVELFYTKLEKGKYRVVKKIDSNGKSSTISAEFEVK